MDSSSKKLSLHEDGDSTAGFGRLTEVLEPASLPLGKPELILNLLMVR